MAIRGSLPVEFKLYPHRPHGMGFARGRGGEVGNWTDIYHIYVSLWQQTASNAIKAKALAGGEGF